MTHCLSKSGTKCTMASRSWICPGTSHAVTMHVHASRRFYFAYFYQAIDDAWFEQKWRKVYNGEHIVDLPWYISLGNHDYDPEEDRPGPNAGGNEMFQVKK